MRWLIIVAILTVSATVQAEDFSPSTFELDVPENIIYQGLAQIPITVRGCDATVMYAIRSLMQHQNIESIRNGHLGWHYVNHVDTVIYVSPPYELTEGEHTLTWEFQSEDGFISPYGEFRCIVWGYGHVPAQTATEQLQNGNPGFISTYDSIGMPLANPVYYTTPDVYFTGDEPGRTMRGRWIIGGDPADAGLLETTAYDTWIENGPLALYREKPERFYTSVITPDNSHEIRCYRWVPNGVATPVADWGEEGMMSSSSWLPPEWYDDAGVAIADDELYYVVNTIKDNIPKTFLVLSDTADGVEFGRFEISEWWQDTDDQPFHGPTAMSVNHYRKHLYLGSSLTCLIMAIDPFDIWNEQDVLFENGYGDGFGERAGGEPLNSWDCRTDYPVEGRFTLAAGRDDVTVYSAPASDSRSRFGVLLPDGTGAGEFFYPGTIATDEYPTGIVDNGTAYDGLYTINDSGSAHGYELSFRPFQVRTVNIGMILFDCFGPDSRHYERTTTSHIAKLLHLKHGIHAPEIAADTKVDVGIFAPSGLCIDHRAFHCPYSIALRYFDDDLYILYGDDPATVEIDGLLPGDELSFRLWRADTGEEYVMQAVYSDEPGGNPGIVYVDSLIVEKKVTADTAPPAAFSLDQNAPNPFNPSTSISYTLPEAAKVRFTVYSALGTEIGTIVDEWQTAGTHTVEWDGSQHGSGVYFYRLDAGEFTDTKRMVLMK